MALWKETRLDFTSGDLDYKGVHVEHGISTADEGWFVWKFTWTSSKLTRIEGPLRGSWNGRANLPWQ